MCPTGAVEMYLNEKKGTFEPVMKPDRCTDCGLCRRICPPLTWPETPTVGAQPASLAPVRRIIAAYSADRALRRAASSGGFVTTFILFLLEKGLITGALLPRQEPNNPLRSRLCLARSRQMVIECMGSKYSPVTFDNVTELIDILPKEERLAVVGLPCHIQGLAMASRNQEKLHTLLRYKIALVCGGSPSFRAYNYIFNKLGVRGEDVLALSNRGDGWPGWLQLHLADGRVVRHPYRGPLSMGMVLSSLLYRPAACSLCSDPHGFHADISVSDAWLPRYTNVNSDGWNLVLVKTEAAAEAIAAMITAGDIFAEDVSADDFILANRRVFRRKLEFRDYGLNRFLGRQRAAIYHRRAAGGRRSHSLGRRLQLFLYYAHVTLASKITPRRDTPLLWRGLIRYFDLIITFLQ